MYVHKALGRVYPNPNLIFLNRNVYNVLSQTPTVYLKPQIKVFSTKLHKHFFYGRIRIL